MSVITGLSRCGIPLYDAISTPILGSTITNLTSSGVLVSSNPANIELIPTDLPVPVAPATNTWGIFARSLMTVCPVISLPSIKGSSYLSFCGISLRAISLRYT